MITKVIITGPEKLKDEVVSMEKSGYTWAGQTQICEHCMKINLYFLKDATEEEKRLVNKLLKR